MAYPYGIGPSPYVTSIWTSNGVFVAPACGDTATETLRPRIVPKATTLDLHDSDIWWA